MGSCPPPMCIVPVSCQLLPESGWNTVGPPCKNIARYPKRASMCAQPVPGHMLRAAPPEVCTLQQGGASDSP